MTPGAARHLAEAKAHADRRSALARHQATGHRADQPIARLLAGFEPRATAAGTCRARRRGEPGASVAQRVAVGMTTVSASVAPAHAAGISVYATGGIGSVHRDGEISGDISADLDALANHPVVTVCAGAKAFLDLPAHLSTSRRRALRCSVNCFDLCFDAWRHYITVSLRGPIVSGAGRQLSHEDDPRMRAEG
jgi:hypothetical protein